MTAVGSGFRLEGRNFFNYVQAAMFEQALQHRIGRQSEVGCRNFQRNVAIAQMIGRLQQCQGKLGSHRQHRLRFRPNLQHFSAVRP